MNRISAGRAGRLHRKPAANWQEWISKPPLAPPPAVPPRAEPSYAQIAELAYSYWLSRGCPIGSPEADWFRAEEQLRRQP
jgi:hypothetical protein